ncbi:MAG: DUF4136 domain-containing protein [Deltaproteobacteria bacterium]|jgi:hypothetical protein|nr:DUF4136 domain-containing protein [Deltaproteobacteria bacterium]
MKQNIFSGTMMVLTVLLLAACTSTSLTGLWKDNAFDQKPLDSIMILGIAKKSDVSQRFEDLFVETFQKKGITSVAAYKIIPESRKLTKDNLKEHKEIIKETAAKNQLNAVLITHLIRVTEQEEDLKSNRSDAGPVSNYRDMGGYSIYVYRNMGSPGPPGRSVTRQYVQLQTNIYDTASEKLIWSASSQSVDPDSVNTIIRELLHVITNQLMADGFIGR